MEAGERDQKSWAGTLWRPGRDFPLCFVPGTYRTLTGHSCKVGCLGTYIIVSRLGGWVSKAAIPFVPTPGACFGASSGHIRTFLLHVVSAQKGTLSDSQTSDTSDLVKKTHF